MVFLQNVGKIKGKTMTSANFADVSKKKLCQNVHLGIVHIPAEFHYHSIKGTGIIEGGVSQTPPPQGYKAPKKPRVNRVNAISKPSQLKREGTIMLCLITMVLHPKCN